ncbi:MAG: phytoene desaturase [Flavobacteriales bacterium]|nr:phytoene desaturase [Flavobacteriales bacterium]
MSETAIVIGAGIGGLASAVRLAVKGYQVTVYEANSYPGGKLSQIEHAGFRFDAGPSLFTMPEWVDELFILAGKDASGYFQYERLQEVCRYFYEDGVELTAHSDPELFAREAAEKTGVETHRVLRHLKKSAYIYDQTAHLFLNRSLHRLSSYFNLKTLSSALNLPFLRIFTSMHKANAKALDNEHLTQLFDRYATYNGSDPYRAPGILHIIPHLEFHRGAYFPVGGMYRITESIYQLARELGVQFKFDTPVTEILRNGDRVSGIRSGANSQYADIIVCNMDVAFAYERLLPGFEAPERLKEQERSSSALIFYWGIEADFPNLLLHNIFFSSDYKAEFRTIFEDSSIFNDPTVYVNISSKHNANDAPEGMENWFVMINVPAHNGQDWKDLIPVARRAILNKLSRMLKQDIEALIVTEDILDPILIEQRTSSFRGALYGTASNKRMAAFFRHPNFNRSLKGLYFCGGSVHPGGGIPLALASARIADSLIPPAKK